jgi:hypothetical protein
MILRAAPTATALNSLLHKQRSGAMARERKYVTCTCSQCGDQFEVYEGAYRYRVSAGYPPKFCSRACMGQSWRTRPREHRICFYCGNSYFYQPGRTTHGVPRKRGTRFCSHECMSAATSAAAADPEFPGYTKGRRLNGDGYVIRRALGDQRRSAKEHILVMEKHLGRRLFPTENVHHKNGDRTDNTPPPDGNLELWDTSHPPGQRVEDKIAFSKVFLRKYGETVSAVTLSDAASGMAGLI